MEIKRMFLNCITLTTALTLSTVCSAQQTWYVDDDSIALGDGIGWTTAFANLHSALGVALAGDEIWIAEGIYVTSLADETISFTLVDGVSLYGGFDGTETTRSQRDPATHVSILSGDVGQDDQRLPFYQQSGWNAGHVIVASNVSPSTIIDGLTIEGGALGPVGTIANDPLMIGSGLYSVDGSVTINNCIFKDNRAAFFAGGGAYFHNGNPTITNTLFENNYGHLSKGAGLYLGGDAGAIIEDCAFRNNTGVFASPDGAGAGIAHQSTGDLVVRNSLFEGNIVRPFYSIGNDVGYGGGIFTFEGTAQIENCVFRNNTATIGGGISIWNNANITNCLFDDNNAVAREGAIEEQGGFGGGLAGSTFWPRDMIIENCTFVNNSGKEHGGASGSWNANLIISNSVFWNNTGWNPEFQGYYREELGGGFDLFNCLIKGIFGPPAFGEDPMDPENLVGTIDGTPIFAGSNDYRLAARSPGIDAGDNASWTSTLTTDLDGNPRFVDDPNTFDIGMGQSPIIDMGAYEYQIAVACPADLTGDGQVDFLDISAFLNAFTAGEPLADFNSDSQYDFLDISAFLDAFAAGCP